MKYLLGLILLISVSASAQYSPTAAKTRFVNGIGLGTKDTLTMNAADTVAMIVGRDSLVYFRYKGYWKPLAYNSSLTGYVPYTGATGSVNLGSYNLTANKIAIGGSISAVALDVHRAGSIVARIENTNSSQDALFAYAQSAQNVWFTGIDYASGANNFGFYYTPDGTTVIRKAYFSNSGDLTANSFIKSGGTSSQFLKADGSVTTIIPSGSIDTGRAVTAIATGGSLNKVRDSLQANIGLKLNISDTATMLSGYKTYYPRAALSAGTGITYNASTGVITNSSPSTGGTVTSVATNTGSGITGGTITSSGTIAADTSVLSTKANVTASLLSKVSSVSGTSPIASSGGLTPTISISQSSGSTNGYLSSTDWNTFNNKGSGSVTSVATDATMTGGIITTSGTLKVDTSIMATRLRVQKGIDSLGAAKQGNITLTTTGTSGAATFSSNTLNIPQYQAAGTYVTSVTGTSPIVSSGGTTPAISIPAATTSVNGYLTSTDWNTFNGKQNALTNPVTGTGTTNYLPKFTGSSTIGNSIVFDDGTNVGIGTTSPSAKLHINGGRTLAITGNENYSLGIGRESNTNAYYLGVHSTSSPNLLFSNNAGTTNMTLDYSGNLGLGVTPSAWGSIFRAEQIGNNGGFLASRTDGINQIQLGVNGYFDGTNWIYTTSEYASRYYQASGAHYWSTAASGTAGNAISFTQAMTLFSDGNLGLGTSTNAGYKLDVNGTGRFSGNVTIGALTGSTTTPNYISLGSSYGTTLANGIKVKVYDGGGVPHGVGVTSGNLYLNTTDGSTDITLNTNSTERLRLSASTGAATFSSSVQTTDLRYSGTGYLTYDASNSGTGTFAIRTGGGYTPLTLSNTGAATFSSTLGINGVADNIKSGTYTPTLTGVYNVTSSTAFPCQYMRVGNVVTVSGLISAKATAANTWTRVSMTLPISSNFDWSYRAGGGGGSGASGNMCSIQAGASTSEVYLDVYPPNSTSTYDYYFSYTYLIM
ncbi:hypothetical protein UFOVP198_45 [uncultured Caudovirales phage]|uniref:Uncharacterized protein n=1 Tax=uncultured Caudovirales phage TaxID=2100421 RepID=A0A6J7WIM9_9CAUD|nr:hypothetical protein UFOVP198_45 [uncultured Caudovirales phage]